VGAAGSFQLAATGYPAPTFTDTGTLPTGMTLTAAGLLSGTPAAGKGGTYTITITASNDVTPNATQSFILTVDQAAVITSAASTTFTVGYRGIIPGEGHLIAAIQDFLGAWNQNPKPFVWTATVDAIVAKLARCRQTLEQIQPGCTVPKPQTKVQLIRGHYTKDQHLDVVVLVGPPLSAPIVR